ncbi:MAG: hypothetical protein WC527_08275, partial [Candidatus Margulisiibacteriota bacterium]
MNSKLIKQREFIAPLNIPSFRSEKQLRIAFILQSFDPPARRAHFGIYAQLSVNVHGKRTATRLVF